jgi:hypothetical protein
VKSHFLFSLSIDRPKKHVSLTQQVLKISFRAQTRGCNAVVSMEFRRLESGGCLATGTAVIVRRSLDPRFAPAAGPGGLGYNGGVSSPFASAWPGSSRGQRSSGGSGGYTQFGGVAGGSRGYGQYGNGTSGGGGGSGGGHGGSINPALLGPYTFSPYPPRSAPVCNLRPVCPFTL